MPEPPQKKFYLTTPIYYVNARPHIGHAYSTIAADVIARRHRLLGEDVFFLTGTDEHGQKVQRSAAAAGIPPQQFTDEVSASFSNLWKRMGITNTDFIRTTDPRHIRGVQKLWLDLEARGAIYLSTYTGQYSVGEEMFVDGPPGTLGPDGKPTETVTEKNYFFRLSDYQLPLLDLIESNTLHIQPDTVRNEVLSFLRGNVAEAISVAISEGKTRAVALDEVISNPLVEAGIIKLSALGNPYVPGALKDLSISRTTFDWGIPVPSDKSGQPHVVYVWLDALVNYLTAIGYGSDAPADIAKFNRYWPADLHLVGKEITRFHCVYWPAFLLAAGLPLPKSVVANGWLLFEESKMSKSRGNVVRTETILDAFGPLCPPPPTIESPLKGTGFSSSITGNPPDAALAAEATPAPPITGGSVGLQPPESSSLKGTGFSPSITGNPPDTALAAEATPTPPITGGSVGLQPPESSAQKEGASAPGISVGLQPHESATQEEGASAPGLRANGPAHASLGRSPRESEPQDARAESPAHTPPTKAQQDLFAADVLRYYLLREIPFGQDGSFSFDALITRYNAELANGYGNFVSRTCSMIHKYRDGVVPPRFLSDQLSVLATNLNALQSSFGKLIDNFEFSRAIDLVRDIIATVDFYVSAQSPWRLAKADTGRDAEIIDEVLYVAAETIRIATLCLEPFLPYSTATVWAQLGLGDLANVPANGELRTLQWGGLKPGTKLGPLSPIFPRADKGLAQIMTDLESPTTEPTTRAPTQEKSVESASSVLSLSPEEAKEAPITIDDFTRIDLRVAQIVVAERIPKADKLLRLEVDLGPDHPRRQILSGIAEWYTPEELIGRRVAIIANLAPRKMRGLESHGMLLAASADAPASKPILATFSDEVPLGSRIR